VHVAAIDNGLFANVLQVLEAALVVSTTGARLDIDWVRKPKMTDFTYVVPMLLYTPGLAMARLPTTQQ
jgi:hypothetical protein